LKSRAAKSRTADLFAAAERRPEVSPARIPPAQPISLASPPARNPHAPPGPKQLWYAAVFPEMPTLESSDAALQKLCLHAHSFTSFVSVEPPNALLLEIKGSVKLFGSLQQLRADLDECWRRLTLPAHSAVAPSTLAALWLARAGGSSQIEDADLLPGYLAKVPIACTAWDIERLQTLRAMGVTSLSELMRLPRAGIARRLGPAVVRDLDIALARQPAPRRAFVRRERFRERCDFETEIEHVAYLEKALEPLIERCARFLRRRQAGIQALQLKLKHREGPATRVQLGLASITSERRRLSDVLCQKLARLNLRAPVRGMELVSGSLRGLSASSLDVFAGFTGAGSRDSAPQLVERLRARLGEAAVYGVCLIPEHRPEAAWRRVHELHLTAAARVVEEISDQNLPRPVWLLNEPLPLPQPEILEGPERIESGWWDGKGVARDYYVARSGRPRGEGQDGPSLGARLWVFQERQSKRWYVHGVFA
jgi:protein ImuB